MALDVSRAKIKNKIEDEESSDQNQSKSQTKDSPIREKKILHNKKKKIQKTMFSLYLEDKVKLEEMVNSLSSELQWEGIKADNSKLIRILIDRAYENFSSIKEEMVEKMKAKVEEVTELSNKRNTASRTRNTGRLV